MNNNPTCRRARGVEKARRVLDFILRYARDHGGNSPSVPTIAKQVVGISSCSHALYYLRALERAGALRRDEDGNIVVTGARWQPPETGENLVRLC
jgi:SOS-response transcriptional repressor LexA